MTLSCASLFDQLYPEVKFDLDPKLSLEYGREVAVHVRVLVREVKPGTRNGGLHYFYTQIYTRISVPAL